MAPAAGTIHIKISRFKVIGRGLVNVGTIMGQFAYTAGAQNADVFPINNQWWSNIPNDEIWVLEEFMIINAAYIAISFEMLCGGVQIFPWPSKGHFTAYNKDYVQSPMAAMKGGNKIYLRMQDATA